MEMMRIGILVSVCAFMSCDVRSHTPSMRDSSEQSALQEALLLVELLKAEYARVLREKSVIKEKEIDEKDLQTCATTTAPTDAVTNTNIPIQHVEQSSTMETLTPYTVHGSRRSYHPGYFPRRRFNYYRDYYGNYGPVNQWRRMDYQNMFGPQPAQTISTSSARPVSVTNSTTDTTLSSISNTALTKASKTTSSTTHLSSTVSPTTPKFITHSITTLKPTKFSLPTILISTTHRTYISLMNNKQPKIISRRMSVPSAVNSSENIKTETKKPTVSENVKLKHKNLSGNTTAITSTYEPEQAQVAAELENELEAAIESSTTLPSSSPHRWSLTWRPTTRLHLARSTPFILPLPENHAFCYTNPKSSLCRTFIK